MNGLTFSQQAIDDFYSYNSILGDGVVSFSGTEDVEGAGSAMPAWAGNSMVGFAIGQAIGAAYGAFSTAKTSSYVLDKQRQVMADNKQRAQLGAEAAFRAGEAQIAEITYKAGQVKGQQRAAYAASGVALDSGSASEVMASSELMKEIDRLVAEDNALASAWGYKNKAAQYGAQGDVAGALSGYMGGGYGVAAGVGSLLDKAGTVADRWYRFKEGY